jgi:hypothetical protein
MKFTFVVEVEVERDEGKFASRDELADQLIQEIEGADPGSLSGDNGGEYSTTSWEVSEEAQAPRIVRKR